MTRQWRSGLVVAHKPVGMTSHAVVRDLLDEVHAQKLRLCHGGTLDPFAEGLLLLLVGHATRLQERLHALPKTYEAVLSWGRETDTGDPGGTATLEGPVPALSVERLGSLTRPLLGWTEQVPPDTSAKKIQGEPAYKKAHRGEQVLLPPSRVYLHEAMWLDTQRVRLTVKGGYYVRAFARDLGRALGCGAHLTALHRTAIGPWHVASPTLNTGPHAVPWLSTRPLSVAEYRALKDRKPIPEGALVPPLWAWPEGFPQPVAEVAATLEDRVVFLLRRADGALVSEELFAGGF